MPRCRMLMRAPISHTEHGGEPQFVLHTPRPDCVGRPHSSCIHLCWVRKRVTSTLSDTRCRSDHNRCNLYPRAGRDAGACRHGSSATHRYSSAYANHSTDSHSGTITHSFAHTCCQSNSSPFA